MKGSSFSKINMIFVILCFFTNLRICLGDMNGIGEQPLSKIAIHKTILALHSSASITASPFLLGNKDEDTEWVTVEVESPEPTNEDRVGVFTPTNFNSSTCPPNPSGIGKLDIPFICSAPIKISLLHYFQVDYPILSLWQFRTSSHLQILKHLCIHALLMESLGMNCTVRGMGSKGWKADTQIQSAAGTLTFNRNSMCGQPARTVGWRDPGFIHTSFLKELWPNMRYTYRLGHFMSDGSYVWSKRYSFKASPYPGQNSLQRVIIFGDMGKAERDGSNEYANYQPGSLNTTDQLIKDLDNFDIVFHIGDMPYANRYISQWDQFTAQVQQISSTVPYMIASFTYSFKLKGYHIYSYCGGNHERSWPNSGSFYDTPDSGGECGVPAETMYYYPAENKAKFWYATDYGMFRFCIADTEHDWREGSEQYKFIEHCLATVDRKQQPWLIFAAHRPLGYSSND
ncbi:purple acid phosphatase [Medicago truncatula]|uniref:Purple acid phosphatase n=1 Tax=Medicago truncatula TaxID=3880 RepID=A0A072V9W1_MEDTR|nr:purple acid phosphatase [Medicago truncatula]